MKTLKPEITDTAELLARVHLTPADRQRAETSLQQGEALADLMLGVAGIVRGWVEHHQQRATDPRNLKSAS